MTDETLLALVEQYREGHPNPFAAEDVIDWALSEGHLSPMTALGRAVAVEELLQALGRAKIRLPDGSQITAFASVGPRDWRSDDPQAAQFKRLTRPPPEEMTREALAARIREDILAAAARCEQLLGDETYFRQLHPDWPPPLTELERGHTRRQLEWPRDALAALDRGERIPDPPEEGG